MPLVRISLKVNMINHFRTLLLNLGYAQNPSEHIPTSFTGAIPLPLELQNFYDLLFPQSASRFYKQFVTTNLLQVIEGTTFSNDVKNYDTRITYDLANSQTFFKVNRFSNPILSNSAFPIFVYGTYHNNISLNDLADTIQVLQQTNTSVVDIYSVTKNIYYATNITLTFANNLSQTISIPTTDITLQIGGNNFTSTSNKKWTFSVEAPYPFDFTAMFTKLFNSTGVVEAMLGYRHNQMNINYENLWRQHPNPVYKVAGLLLAYIERVNTLV